LLPARVRWLEVVVLVAHCRHALAVRATPAALFAPQVSELGWYVQVAVQHVFAPVAPGVQTAPLGNLHLALQHALLSSQSSPVSMMPLPHTGA
jgi:hypothetical protein